MVCPNLRQALLILKEGNTLLRYRAPSTTGFRYFIGLTTYAVNQISPKVGRILIEEGYVKKYEFPDETGNKEYFKINEGLQW